MIRVASYCRVSTDREDQANSFDTQQRYFRAYIERQSDWELYRVYADEGLSGTDTKKRAAFNAMMDDARAGRFQLIITKEVSRFSRNILDTIGFTRELRALGVGVLFVNDGINTLDPDAELRLSIMGSIAQEESRRTSNRVVWGQTRQMERGVVFGPSLLGYDVKHGRMKVNPEGAALVRLIFRKYALEQMGTTQIARFLTEAGYRTPGGCGSWKPGTVIKILKNEKYVGDLVQKKTYTPDYLTHEKRRNAGQVPLITIANHHEPIISRKVWDLARERMARRDKHVQRDGGHSDRYVFSGKIKCSLCGAAFTARYKTLKDGNRVRRWCCGTTGCGIGKLVRNDDARQMLRKAVSMIPMDFGALIDDVTELALDAVQVEQKARREDPEHIRVKIDQAKRKKEAVMDSYFAGTISKDDMLSMGNRYEQQIRELNCCLAEAVRRKEAHTDQNGLRIRLREEIAAIVHGQVESEAFEKAMIHQLTVFKDRHLELRLNLLEQVFHFA